MDTARLRGTDISIPDQGEDFNWGTNLNDWILIATGILQTLGFTNVDDPKSLLTLISTTKGVKFPKMTTAQRTAIGPGVDDDPLFVYDSTLTAFYYWNGTNWIALGSGGGGGSGSEFNLLTVNAGATSVLDDAPMSLTIVDNADPRKSLLAYWNTTTLVITESPYMNAREADIAGFLCLYKSGSDLVIKNNTASNVTLGYKLELIA